MSKTKNNEFRMMHVELLDTHEQHIRHSLFIIQHSSFKPFLPLCPSAPLPLCPPAASLAPPAPPAPLSQLRTNPIIDLHHERILLIVPEDTSQLVKDAEFRVGRITRLAVIPYQE